MDMDVQLTLCAFYEAKLFNFIYRYIYIHINLYTYIHITYTHVVLYSPIFNLSSRRKKQKQTECNRKHTYLTLPLSICDKLFF